MSLVTWIPTPLEIVKEMLELAGVGPEDVICDLGSGDGRVLVMAAREFGVRKAVGYELKKDLCEFSQRQIKQLNLQDKITIIEANVLDADLSEASVITLYLTSSANEILRPKLEKHKNPKGRIVSYLFPLNGWRVAKTVNLRSLRFHEGSFIGMLYLYSIPQAFEHFLPTMKRMVNICHSI